MEMFFQICVLVIHLYMCIHYLSWGCLNSDRAKMDYLNMLFITDIHEFSRNYDVDVKLAKKLMRSADSYKRILCVWLGSFTLASGALIFRCLTESYLTIPFEYFLLIVYPMAMIDLFNYMWLCFSFLVNVEISMLTYEFVILKTTTGRRSVSRIENRVRQEH